MKKYLFIVIILLGIPAICASQFFPTGGYQKGGHGSGGDSPTGIFDESLAKLTDQVRIYPNPTSAELTIEAEVAGQCSIEITSPVGQLIISDKMEGTAHEIDISSFRKGIYFITIRSKDFVKTEKVIKF